MEIAWDIRLFGILLGCYFGCGAYRSFSSVRTYREAQIGYNHEPTRWLPARWFQVQGANSIHTAGETYVNFERYVTEFVTYSLCFYIQFVYKTFVLRQLSFLMLGKSNTQFLTPF